MSPAPPQTSTGRCSRSSRWRMRESLRLAPRLAEIRCPVRLVLGTAPHQGGVEPEFVRLMRERLPRFDIDSVPGAGQYLFEEQPEVVAGIIARAMKQSVTVTSALVPGSR